MSENSHIEQFLILAKGQKAKPLETIVEQILSHPNIYVFGEFLNLPNVQDMGKESKHLQTLNLFAYETYQVYKKNPKNYIELKPQMQKKLKMITIAEMASQQSSSQQNLLKYSHLMKELDIKSLRELEDLIIDCMYNDLLKGTLDQKDAELTVEYTYGRDSRPEDIDQMIKKLEDWDCQLEKAQTLIEKQVTYCNDSIKKSFESQVKNELDSRKVRDDILKALSEGKNEVNGFKLSKQRSKKEEMGGASGGSIGDFLSGLTKATYSQQQRKEFRNQQQDDEDQVRDYKTQFYQDPSLGGANYVEEEEDIDVDQVSNAELQAKIRKMKEKLRLAQEQSYDGAENQGSESDRQSQNQYLKNNYQKEVQQIYQNSDIDREGGVVSAQSSIRKDELKSKIKDLKNAIAQFQHNEDQEEDEEGSSNREASAEDEDEEIEMYNKEKIRRKQQSNVYLNQEQPYRSQHDYIESNSRGGRVDPKQKRDKSNSRHQIGKSQINQRRVKEDHKGSQKQQLETKSQKIVKNQNKHGKSRKRKQHNRDVSNDRYSKSYRDSQSEEESVSQEEEEEEEGEDESRRDEESSGEDEEEDEEDEEQSSSEDDRVSKHTQKSKKSKRNGKQSKEDQASYNATLSPNFTGGAEWANQQQIPNQTGFFPNPQMQPGQFMHPQQQMMMGGNPQNMADMAMLYQQNQLQGFQQQMLASNYMMQNQYQNLLMQNQQFQQNEQTLQTQLQQANQQVQSMQGQNQEMEKEIQHLQIMIQDQRNQYEQEIKMMHRDYAIQLDELSQWKNDNMFLIDKHEALQSKFQNLKKEFDEQKDFYEKALEQRFAQMEEYENECFELRRKVEHYETFDKDNKIKADMALKDKEDLKKKLEKQDRENLQVTRKEEELQKKIEDLQKQLKEREQVSEKKTEDNFNLKETINSQKKEIDKLKKQNETYQDQVTNKELQLKQVSEDFSALQKKHKVLSQQQDFKQQFEESRIELLNTQSQNNQLRMELDSLNDQLFDMRSQLDSMDEVKRDRDQLRRELQNMPKPQRNNENHFQGRGDMGNSQSYDYPPQRKQQPMPPQKQQQEESFWPSSSANQQNNQQKRAIGRKQSPPQNQQYNNNKYNLPPSFFQDNDYTEEQVLQKARQFDDFSHQQQPRQHKPLVNDRSNNLNRQVPQPIVGKPLTKEEKERERKMDQARNIEQNLLSLQLEQKKLVSEFDKIPDNAKTMAQRRRKEELEREIQIVNKNISSMRNKLRELDALFK